MSQADHAYTTPEQFFWNGYRSAEQATDVYFGRVNHSKKRELIKRTS